MYPVLRAVHSKRAIPDAYLEKVSVEAAAPHPDWCCGGGDQVTSNLFEASNVLGWPKLGSCEGMPNEEMSTRSAHLDSSGQRKEFLL